MGVKRTIITTSRELYLNTPLPLHVNRMTESFELEQHRHEFIELNYVSEGRGFHYIEEERMPVARGDLFYLPLGVSHVFRPAAAGGDGGRLIVHNCLFDGRLLERLTPAYGSEPGMAPLTPAAYPEQGWLHARDEDGFAGRVFRDLLEEFASKRPGFEAMMIASLVRVLVYLRRAAADAPDSASGSPVGSAPGLASGSTSGVASAGERHGGREAATDAPVVRGVPSLASRIDEAARLVAREPHVSYTVQALADAAGVSERHFRRRFAERLGMPFTSYVHAHRIELACRLLAEGGHKIAAVADFSGYRDLSFFNRLFKSKTGLTPRQYRAQHRR
ncbi:helix-turn-helix transcriptional regulator [Paenibacillus sp. IB182496]|uniref:Helix-turn-helix transcriptional regulator n=1 Tax=Paenibacillus sabuli TaxID=2772509 RepID=A0A927GT08_9BACL|nr:AraC family transcriptional regulator [Paenibacillus sabuli]MBD2846841.1 helix-turn-helix transcriptional regulator [Paenibacillus sabuli]